MTTIRQLIQSSPAKAIELFAKLVDTSESAVKTRDRLFSELKGEIELHSKLEEQHLFPVLKKHKETKDLVADALNDNRETRKLLAELERTPKDSEAFATKVADLQKVFQQHVRDDKKEFLPAILKVLSDEEAEAVVEKIEDGKAEIETARRDEAQESRAEAKREQEAADRVKQAAKDTADAVRTGAEDAQKVARKAQDAVQRGLQDATEGARRTADQFASASAAATQQAREGADQLKQGFEALTRSSAGVMRGYEAVSREWMDMSRNGFQKNMEGLNAMMKCRSLPELVAAQSALIRENLTLTQENGRRLADISVGIGTEAARSIGRQPEKKATQSRQAA